jgi:hypothetical protein
MKRWLKARVGSPVYVRLADEGRTILLSRVGWNTVEGIDADGDEVCMRLRGVTAAFAGEKVAEGFEATRLLRRKIYQAAHGVCDCEDCAEERRREAHGQLSQEEIEAVLAEDGLAGDRL